jgi:hypothetical protein
MSKEIVDAINDLTRVMIALNGKFETKAEAVRKMNELSIPPARIAAILAMDLKAVHTVLTRLRQSKAKGDKSDAGPGEGPNG